MSKAEQFCWIYSLLGINIKSYLTYPTPPPLGSLPTFIINLTLKYTVKNLGHQLRCRGHSECWLFHLVFGFPQLFPHLTPEINVLYFCIICIHLISYYTCIYHTSKSTRETEKLAEKLSHY